MDLLPQGTLLGRLRIAEVWDYYDVPRLFVAQNAAQATYVAFWADEDDAGDAWLYSQVSDLRLEAVRCGKLSLRQAYVQAEDGNVFVVRITADGASAQVVAATDVRAEWLPREGDFVHLLNELLPAARPRETSQHSVVIRPLAQRRPVPFEGVADILSRWQGLFGAGMQSFGITGDLTPVDASIGSFKVTLSVDDPDITARVLERIADVLQQAQSDVGETSANFALDISLLGALLERLEQYGATVDVAIPSSESGLHLSPSANGDVGRSVLRARMSRPLDTLQVPQADDIDKVMRVLDLRAEGVEITTYTLGVVPRQLAYYKHACRLLGYLDDQNELTNAGRQLVGLAREDRLRTTAIQFEQSDCGYAWLRWSGVRKLPEINEQTAERFLQEASRLGTTTAPRRAETLRSWHRVLAPFHYR